MMEGSIWSWNLFPALEFVCKQSPLASRELSKYLHKEIWSPSDRSSLLESLTYLFVEELGVNLAVTFRPLLVDIVARCRYGLSREKTSLDVAHQKLCIALGNCLHWPDVKRLAVDYLQGHESFLKIQDDDNLRSDTREEPRRKKQKKSLPNNEAICQAAWLFAYHLGDTAIPLIPLDDLLPHLTNENKTVRWFCCHAVMQLQNMSSAARETFLQKYFSETDILRLKLRYNMIPNKSSSEAKSLCVQERVPHQTHTKKLILETDLSEMVTCVGGILLTKVAPSKEPVVTDLLPVPSNEANMYILALAVSSGSPVLLQGVVGSGKTSLVEHLAKITDRARAPQLMKIQLGDQMDSKALLGTYRCTEVPGEFVWQPGVLTQAVTNGYWVLLEDIDYAPMEVVSVLLPLLETRCLSVPGHGDNIPASPGFQLFATQRLMGGSSGWHRQQTGSSVLLEKLWTKILVEPLSRTELSQVIGSKFPQLSTVIDRLLDIYFLLSAGDHSGAEAVAMETEVESVGKFLSHDGRMISTRDLMNWCHRIAQDFDVTSSASSNLVFQEAVDCFVACLSRADKRMPLAEAIGAKLNITKVKAEFFCLKYKPEVKMTTKSLSVGRVSLPVKENLAAFMTRKRGTFSFTRQSTALLERVAVCVSNSEPVLLVGETGTGKTSSVQYLAEQLGHKLHVINMNQQSDSADLLGGFKPVDLRFIIKPFFEDFELLFIKTFSQKQNVKFQGHLQDCFSKRKWDTLFSLMDHTTTSALKKFDKGSESRKKWKAISQRLKQLKIQVQQTQNALAFSFIEGSLVKAIRNGDWILLDEINLAAMETLECLSGLLESTAGSVLLMERGDMEPVVRHPDFRLFACMNPATDVGKKDLSPGIRNRFTELFVDELEDSQDLKVLVSDYLQGLSLSSGPVDGIVKFYLLVRNEAVKKLTDGTGHQPHFSLRTLCRALRFAALNSCGSVPRSLYEGFCLSFLTQLDRASHPVVEQLICQHIISKSNVKATLRQALPVPGSGKYLKFEGYWISVGELEPSTPDNYILTPSVRANLADLARIVSAGQHPVLLQGETSVGKTSLITWLARSSGNVCVRVNNHEHTDLQEYVGCYAADENGKLAFREGVLVEAMRKGHWIILDELNLAPTDVLEALNRLLDDNRELYIPETQETVKAHPKFMLFATQNPPGHYGGRKILSRAFRNRFIELHFDEIPSGELETILHQRCDLPLSYAKRLTAVMLELQTRRRGSGVFAGKMGFMTLRDLFRWAERYKCFEMENVKFYDWDKHLADQGHMLLAGRVRKPEEVAVIQEVIQKHFKCKVSIPDLYTLSKSTSLTTRSMLGDILSQSAEGFQHIVWTQSMRRLAVLIGQAMKYKEPILLVGETGCGKTTMCQLYAAIYNTSLYSVNCHLHTESADFLGGLRPVRSHTEEDSKDKLFEWVDGPLVKAMKQGAMFLIDEISLADDSVLERLNSVLEPERTILLAEKGGSLDDDSDVEQIVAKEGFHVFATMNPGGDFGKKELSPALRNRFTEIWCPPSNQRQDLIDIIEHNLNSGIHLSNQEDGTSGVGRAIMEFVDWFTNNELGKRCTVSIRDILSWVQFINTCSKTVDLDQMDTGFTYNQLEPAVAYIHGACLVFLDGLGAGTTSQGSDVVISQLWSVCLKYLLKQVNAITHHSYGLSDLYLLGDGSQVTKDIVMATEDQFCIPPFSILRGERLSTEGSRYALNAPGTCLNAQRVLRALQLARPLLLEGSPGVGKTSLVGAIAKAAGRDLVRINLSEQTDVTDLFGADLPVEGAEGGVFAWRDGPLLQALKAGSWIVLDELNLASQSVLEGLNACLDHRAEVYVPELGKTFHIQHEKTRLFACQNPLNQGGGRKGLPRSFLNRFTQVYVEPLSQHDLMFIASTMYPTIPQEILSHMVLFNMKIYEETVLRGEWGQRGSPWEFNLRDLFRWCDLLLHNQKPSSLNPGEYLHLIYADRMRGLDDKGKVYELYEKMFPSNFEAYKPTGVFHCGAKSVQIGHSFLPIEGQGQREKSVAMEILHHSLEPLESLMKCVEMNWMAILVGPQSCGKSAVVQMLASLTGNHLNVLAMNSAMDTTELLGGFEQADVSRHVEEMASDINNLVHTLCQVYLLQQDNGHSLDTVARLQKLWRQYSTVARQGEKKSNLEEHEAMKDQVEKLLDVLQFARKMAKKIEGSKGILQNIANLKQKLISLVNKLTAIKPGSGGGAFEWIDSLLVKSLQSGEWLLVDNVNFCSASVLDRLNALLEPHGVLSINERGVIDGQIPTIKPHPNFRLFLSMDPKHGEISRAMRNREVEIFIPGEDDGRRFSETDLRLISTSLGLESKLVFDWLLTLHNSLKESLPRGDKPNIPSLLEVCRLTKKQLDHGLSLKKSLYSACHSVLVQAQRNKTSKQLSLDILNEHSEKLEPSVLASSCQPEIGIAPIRLPDIELFQIDPRLANARRHIAVFTYLIDSCEEERLEARTNLQIKHSFTMMLNSVSEEDCSLTIRLVQNHFKGRQPVISKYYRYLVDSLHEVTHSIFTALAPLTSPEEGSLSLEAYPADIRWNVQAFTKILMETNDTDSVKSNYLISLVGSLPLEAYPADIRWNVQAFTKILMETNDTDSVKSNYLISLNRVSVQQYAMVELYLLNTVIEKLQAAVEKDKERSKSSLHPAVSHMVRMFPLFKSMVISSLPAMDLSTYDETTKILDELKWLGRLLNVSSSVVVNQSENMVAQLALHWDWFQNRTIPRYDITLRDQQLGTILNILEGMLGRDDSRRKTFVRFWSNFGYPVAFKTKQEAENHVNLMKLLTAVDVSRESSDLMSSRKVKAIICRRQFILQKIEYLFSILEGDHENQDTFDEYLSALKAHFRSFGVHVSYETEMETDSHVIDIDQSGDCKSVMSLPVEHVQLWPVSEYLCVMARWNLVNCVLQGNLKTVDSASLINFLTQYTPVCGSELKLLQTADEKNMKESTPLLLKNIYKKLWKGLAVHQPMKWLNWGDHDSLGMDEGISDKRDRTVHEALVSFLMFTLLSRASNDNVLEPANIKVDSPLAGYKQGLSQLAHIGNHIWSNMAAYGSKRFCPRYLDKTNIMESFHHLLACLKSFVDEEISADLDLYLNESRLTSLGEISVKWMEKIINAVSTRLINLDQDLQKLVALCFESMLLVAKDKEGEIADLGEAWIHLGHLQMSLLAPKGPVDPVERQAIKLTILKDELLEAETELEVRSMNHKLLTGHDLATVSPSLVHPRIPYLLQKIGETTLQISELSSKVAYRPETSQYEQLIKDIDNYLNTVTSADSLEKLLRKLKQPKQKTSHILKLLQEVELWERTQDKFVSMLEEEYPLYRDVTTPYITAVYQLVHGFRLMSHCVQQRQGLNQILRLTEASPTYKELQFTLEHLLIGVGKFPTVSRHNPSCHKLAVSLTSDTSLSLVKNVMASKESENQWLGQMVSQSVLNSCLLHIQNEALVRGELSDDLRMTLTQILEVFVLSWQQEQQRLRDKEEEEASIYRFKSQVHGDDRSEEERLEQEFRENFPLFEQEFMDFVEPTSLEDDVHKPPERSPETEKSDLAVTEAQMTKISSVHQQLYKHLTETDWFKPVGGVSRSLSDWIEPLLTSYTAASKLGLCLADILDSNVDRHLLGGHLVVCFLQQLYVTEDSANRHLLPPVETYNIYHDANVPEVIKCVPVFRSLLSRVHQLQEEWPDHPTLKQLCDIVARIESFPITSPVIKFLTGIELLVQKAQDWESNASQHVSMVTQLGEMSGLIVEWRKLELSCWSNALDTEVTKCRQTASKWWFHMYQLIQSVRDPQSQTETDESENAAIEKEDKVKSDADVIKTFKQFMEQASLGEFNTRLDMLLSFHCQLVSMETSPKLEMLKNVLWNLYQFYDRFTKIVSDELARLRTPIEKELKGFVKIARWSDINYWALKQTTEKTHRTLHKFIKRFQVVLQQPVKGILGDVDVADTEKSEDTWVSSVKNHEKRMIERLSTFKALDAVPTYTVLEQFQEHIPLQCRLPTLSTKFNRHWKQTIRKAGYTDLTDTLDQFTGELIEAIHELQALEVSKGEDKEKQKSEAKHINLRKRKSLSDLFRYLTKLGLSYRKGLTLLDSTSDEPLLVPPLDIQVSGQQLEDPGEHHVLDVWQGCQQYYYRCISRKAQFTASLASPSKELGLGNLERCKGFTEHLFKLVIQQYRNVATVSQQCLQLRCALQNLEHIRDESRPLPPQIQAKEWMNTLKNLTVQMTEGLNQFLVILHCCPRQQEEITTHPSPLPVSQLHQMALARSGDQLIEGAITDVETMLKEIDEMRDSLSSMQTSSLFTWSVLKKMRTLFECLETKVPTMQHLAKRFCDPESDQPNAFNDVLHFLSEEISQKSGNFRTWIEECLDSITQSTTENCDMDAVEKFAEETEELISAVLLVVQKLSKHHSRENKDGNEREATDDDEEIIKEGHLVKCMCESLQEDVSFTDSTNIINMLSRLISKITTEDSTSTLTKLAYQSLLQGCQPLLQQYQQVLQFHLVVAIATERTMGKLLSVLLGVFTELTMKGFCIPPEFSDELEGEGATDFKDIEGGGIGEGEGVKDVSDQIESEDQLEEAKKPEDYNKEEEKTDQPDIKSEDNAIEMSDDLEGKLHDLEKCEDDKEDEKDGEDEEELDRQMGEVDEKETEKLDEQMWGSDDEEEGSDNEETKDEFGPGDGKQSEPELVAADDNKDKSQDDTEQDKKETDDGDEENNEEQKTNNLDQLDQDNYDDDQVDPYHGEDRKEEQAPDDLDLPDDLKLDDDKDEAGKDEEPAADETGTEEDKTTLPPEDSVEQDETVEEKEEDEKLDRDDSTDDKSGEEEKREEDMETDGKDRQEEEGKDEPGLTPQDDSEDLTKEEDDSAKKEEEKPMAAENYGKTSHDTEAVEQSESAQDQAGQADNNQDEAEGSGQASSEQMEGHQGQQSTQIADSSTNSKRKKHEREPGKSDSDRSLGSTDQKYKKLKTTDSRHTKDDTNEEEGKKSDLYEHIQDSKQHYDAQTLDVATADQQEQQPIIKPENEEADSDLEDDDDVKMADEDKDSLENLEDVENLHSAKLKKSSQDKDSKLDGETEEDQSVDVDSDKIEIPGERATTDTVMRGPESTIHTALENLHLDSRAFDLEKLRLELEDQLGAWSQSNIAPAETEATASELWHRYEALTSSLSQDLCEQLRLVLEPSQATKLRGDYRTGKRLNMRKVIPYIASQFRKDKIWLRRTKPSKRHYQVMLAVDDSSSMVDNHSKQYGNHVDPDQVVSEEASRFGSSLFTKEFISVFIHCFSKIGGGLLAFESLALVSNALTLLEAGELAISSFGEEVRLLHPFTEQFTSQSGARLLQYFTFEQKKTKIAQLLKHATSIMLEARQRQHGMSGNPDTSQLLLIVSDGRGLFLEGMEVVKTAVRQAREANVFLVFVVLDNPLNKISVAGFSVPIGASVFKFCVHLQDSILDIKVPIFKQLGQVPEIKSYMDSFPFPFYIILRDINSLPSVLSDALRQWFELVTAVDR